jgi:cobalt/nickel transport protein
MNQGKRLWGGLILLILLSPLGLILPEIFRSGPAWGEWSLEELERMLGFLPEGLKKWTDFWSSPLPEYHLTLWEKKGLFHSGLAYILSGFLGAGAVAGITLLLGKWMGKKDPPGSKSETRISKSETNSKFKSSETADEEK